MLSRRVSPEATSVAVEPVFDVLEPDSQPFSKQLSIEETRQREEFLPVEQQEDQAEPGAVDSAESAQQVQQVRADVEPAGQAGAATQGRVISSNENATVSVHPTAAAVDQSSSVQMQGNTAPSPVPAIQATPELLEKPAPTVAASANEKSNEVQEDSQPARAPKRTSPQPSHPVGHERAMPMRALADLLEETGVRDAQRDGKPQQPAAVARAQALQEELRLEQRIAQQAARLRESSAVKGNSSAAKIGNEQSAQQVVNKSAAQVIASSPSGGGVVGTASDAAAGAQENGARGDRVAPAPIAPVATAPPAASVVSGNMRTQVLSEVLAQEQATDKAEAPARMLAARGLTALASQKGGSITMRLDPPMLGELTIRMTVTKGVVEASMQTATNAARVILERGADQLRTSLEARGLSVERLSIHGPAHQSETSGARADGGREDGARGQGTENNDERREDAAGEESRGRSDRDDSSAKQHAPTDESFSTMIDATTLSEEAA